MCLASKKKTIELLAPAKDFAHGQAVLMCGADAIYIGAPRFGARAAAGTSVEEITRLCDLAHLYSAKVYVAMNTLLYDDELDSARELAWEMYRAGADALIVQDMAFLAMDDMPPIALHSSTQMCNNDAQTVAFLAQSGFSRVVLERAMSLEDMAAVSRASDVELEAFVHGAICVCNSGRCYMSLSMGSDRSGNRGSCIQSCRMPYDLLDSRMNPVRGLEGKHLLSVSDMNRSGDLRAMIDAGISSFKIEGRLKDMNYVKNIVSYYRRKLDDIIASDSSLVRSSRAESRISFEPNPAKSFARGATNYFLYNAKTRIANFESPKSTGYYIGTVCERGADFFVLSDVKETADKGDGICFYDGQGRLCGSNINKLEGRRVYPNRMDDIKVGVRIFKNFDRQFAQSVEGCTARRTLDVDGIFSFNNSELSLSLESCGIRVEHSLENEFSPARNLELAARTIQTQLKKSSSENFEIRSIELPIGQLPFVAVSVLNQLRRESLELLEKAILKDYRQNNKASEIDRNIKVSYPYSTIHGDNSVVNSLSREFYASRGVEKIDPATETLRGYDGAKVMSCRYCLRRELGACLKDSGADYNKSIPREDLYIRTGPHTYKLSFDCRKCEMYILKYGQ